MIEQRVARGELDPADTVMTLLKLGLVQMAQCVLRNVYDLSSQGRH
jgi:hypothetical protein